MAKSLNKYNRSYIISKPLTEKLVEEKDNENISENNDLKISSRIIFI